MNPDDREQLHRMMQEETAKQGASLMKCRDSINSDAIWYQVTGKDVFISGREARTNSNPKRMQLLVEAKVRIALGC